MVTSYVSAPGGVRPLLYGAPNTGVVSQTNQQAPQTHRPVIPTKQPLAATTAVPNKPQNVIQGTVVISAQGLPPAQQMQHAVVATPPQTPPLSTAQTVTPFAQPASQNLSRQEVLTPDSTQDEAMEMDQSGDGMNSHQNMGRVSTDQYEACLPVNRPPSRRRSCSGSSAHGSPPRSPKRPTRTRSPKSPKSPQSKSPKSPRPLSPKITQSRLSARADIDINSDMSHAQMERIREGDRVPLQETAIERVENPCLKIIADQADQEKPNTRRKSAESRASQNGNVKLNCGSNTSKVCTSVDIVSSRTTDESHTRTGALHMNGEVLSPAPSDSSTTTSDPMSPKRNGANPTTSPSILDKKAKIAQLLQDTKAAKEALGLGQNGIVTHLGNGDCTESKGGDQISQDNLPTAEGLTKQMAEATALMPESNGCDDNLLSESTDGINDRLADDDSVLAYYTDGTNDHLQEDPERSTTSTVTTVTMSHGEGVVKTVITTMQPSQHQGTVSHASTATTSTLEQTTEQSSTAQLVVTGDQINTQVVNTDSCNAPAQSSLMTGTAFMSAGSQTAQSPSGNSFQTDKPGSAAIAELLQRKLLNNSQAHGVPSASQGVIDNSSAANTSSQVMPKVHVSGQQFVQIGIVTPGTSHVRPTVQSSQPTTQQSHLMQQLQQRLQRPNPNTQQHPAQTVCQTSQFRQQSGGMETFGTGTNDSTLSQVGGMPGANNVTTTHAAVQQQLLQRLKASQIVQNESLLQQRLQPLQGVNVPQVSVSQSQQLQQSEPHHPVRPASTGPPSRPPSMLPSVGPQVRPPSTGPAPLPSPSGSSDASTLPASPPPGGAQPARRPSTASTASTDSKAAGTVKAKKRKAKSNSIESRRSSNASLSSEIQYVCQWNECNM